LFNGVVGFGVGIIGASVFVFGVLDCFDMTLIMDETIPLRSWPAVEVSCCS
jgi:hypothetical protein